LFTVHIAIEKKGEFETFTEAFRQFWGEIDILLDSPNASLQILETACWIGYEADTVRIPLYFYAARDLAYDIGLVKLVDDKPVLQETSREPSFVEIYDAFEEYGML
jgi:hypothetical protein